MYDKFNAHPGVVIGPLLVKLRGVLSDTSKPRRNYVFSLVQISENKREVDQMQKRGKHVYGTYPNVCCVWQALGLLCWRAVLNEHLRPMRERENYHTSNQKG